MRKKLKTMLVLTFLAGIAGLTLAFMQQHTRDLIGERQSAHALAQLQGLVPELSEEDLCALGIALEEHEVRGYGGPMTVVLAFQERTLLGVRVTKHTETPGFSDSLEPDDWLDRFSKEPITEIDAVTRATITTSAVLQLVRDRVTSISVEGSSC